MRSLKHGIGNKDESAEKKEKLRTLGVKLESDCEKRVKMSQRKWHWQPPPPPKRKPHIKELLEILHDVEKNNIEDKC